MSDLLTRRRMSSANLTFSNRQFLGEPDEPQHSRDNGANPMVEQMLDGRAKAVEQPCDAPMGNVLTRTIDKFVARLLGCALGR